MIRLVRLTDDDYILLSGLPIFSDYKEVYDLICYTCYLNDLTLSENDLSYILDHLSFDKINEVQKDFLIKLYYQMFGSYNTHILMRLFLS